MSEQQKDIFLSHASEDKETVALPLARLLEQSGLTVWLDVQELSVGDRLRESLDAALRVSRFGVVILSPAFFIKTWPQRELSALLAMEKYRNKVILPVLHNLNSEQVALSSPLLADRIFIQTEVGLSKVAADILNAVRRSSESDKNTKANPNSLNASSDFLDPSNLVGKYLGIYPLQEYLGHGGSGIVFRTEHRDLGSKLAIKVFYPLQPAYFQFHALMERGLQALSQIRHPNILSIRAFGSASIGEHSVSYALMDLVHGSNLQDWSESIQGEPDALKRRLNVALQIAEGLHVSHNTTYTDEWGFDATGILHGDIKPSNIFVEPNDFAKIGDFMLIDFQRLLDPNVIPPALLCRQGPNKIATTAIFGTPGFMAPEQERFGVVTPRTDIFSFGVTLGYLLSPADPMYIGDPTLDISSKFRKLISSMLAADPSRRPMNMSEVVDCLREEFSAKAGQRDSG